MKIYAIKHSYSDGDQYEPYEGMEYEEFYLKKDNAAKRLKEIYDLAKNQKEEIETELCIIYGLDIDPETIQFRDEDWLQFDETCTQHVFEIVTIVAND